MHLPKPTSKKNPSLGYEHFATVSSVHFAQPAKQAVGTTPVAGATAGFNQKPNAGSVHVTSEADFAVQTPQPSGHLIAAPVART